jgi:hypothetical protein
MKYNEFPTSYNNEVIFGLGWDDSHIEVSRLVDNSGLVCLKKSKLGLKV